jgi:hypothetical protein
MEVYRTGPTYPNTNFLAYLGSDGKFSLARACRAVASPLIRGRITPAATERNTRVLRCTLAKPAQLDVVPLPAGTRLLVIVPPATVVAVANIRPAGSAVTYNSRVCKPGPPPA